MDLSGPIFDNIKIEADSDSAFFGFASVNDGAVNSSSLLAEFSNTSNRRNKLSTLLSSASPYTISNPNSSPTSSSVGSPGEVSPSSDYSENSLGDALFSADIVEQLELDLPEFSCDFDILDDDGLSSALLRDDSDSKDSGTSSTPEVFFSGPQCMDSPPLTPPSPVIKVETETKPQVGLGQIPSNVLPIIKNLPNSLTKILPALKSSRGRSASHDSPDVQALKRHIRMIRNRESASLSRKKKKEYVTSLEEKLHELAQENSQLKQENQLLKTRLLLQHNQCITKTNGGSLPNNSGRSVVSGNKTKLIAKVALLGVCCFMLLSANAPNQNHHSNSNNAIISNTTVHSKVMQNFAGEPDLPRHLTDIATNHLRISRSLAWRDNFKEEISHEEKVDIPDKIIKASTTNFTLEGKQFSGVSTNITKGPSAPTVTVSKKAPTAQSRHQSVKPTFNNVTLPSVDDITGIPTSNCKATFNKTESLRVQNDLKGFFSRGKPKKKAPTRPFFYSLMDTNTNNNKGLTIYDQRMQRYSNILEKIQLREDTFYVVSLAMEDQLLLSAKSSNASSRPKMSFLMPWMNDLGGKEDLMQIDCEVTKVRNLHNLKKASKA